ncbi:MAG: DNA polymerase III subunit delta [Endomicrobium sp.]|jgi:DNA polymerase-3 subunit delta|nr:DNA polymerase III subunit delta [Endomicrobium sp.]
MAFIKFQDFNKLISSKKSSSVYLFAGEESYLIDSCLKKLSLALSVDDLNREVFYASDSSAEDILNAVQTLPFLSEKRVVIVKAVNKMKAVDAERLSDYLSNVIDTSCLILLYPDNYKKETIAKRKELIGECSSSKNCVAVDCRKQYESEVKEFIKSEFTAKGKSVSFDVISKIIDENGADLMNISNEIEKLCLFAGKNKKAVTEDDIEQTSGYTKEANVYALASEIESKNIKKAMFILEKLLAEGGDSVMILSTISSTVRKLLNAKSMIEEKGMSNTETAAALRIHNYFAKAFFSNLTKHSIKNLKSSLKVILKADTAIKTGASDAISSLEKIILSVCR